MASDKYFLATHIATPLKGETRRGDIDSDAAGMKVMSYNIWNFNSDWETRKQLIVNTVKQYQPDIIGFQEIRFKYDSVNRNQLMQMGELLPNYNYVYQPAMRYDTEAEGVGIMTLYPIVYTNFTDLKFTPDTPDRNKRIALRGLLDTPHGPFDFFVTHFSYAKGAGQMQNAVDLLNFMDLTVQEHPSQVVVGDFNIYPDSVGPTDFLTGKRAFRGKMGNLRDAWESIHGKDDGFTFSNLPWSPGLQNRADRILYRGAIAPLTVERVGEYKPAEQEPASDHLAVLADFHVAPQLYGTSRK